MYVVICNDKARPHRPGVKRNAAVCRCSRHRSQGSCYVRRPYSRQSCWKQHLSSSDCLVKRLDRELIIRKEPSEVYRASLDAKLSDGVDVDVCRCDLIEVCRELRYEARLPERVLVPIR